MQVGDKVWIFDNNRRYYKDDKGNKLTSSWYRGHFIELYIVGETTQSWLVGYKGENPDNRSCIKVNKKTLSYKFEYGRDGHLYTSEEEIDKNCWVNDNQYKIHEAVNYCNDYDKLKAIEEILKESTK